MRLDLNTIFDEKKTLEIDTEITVSDLNSNGNKHDGMPFKITGRVVCAAGVVTLSYLLELRFTGLCDICLCEIRRVYSYKADHVLVNSVSAEEYPDDFIICPDGILDLSELARSDLFLNLPSVFTCSDDCKGLCRICGNNLNEKACDCGEKTQNNSPFAALKSLLDN